MAKMADVFEKIEYGYAEDNFWYDLTVWNDFHDDIEAERLDKVKKLKENVYTEIYEKIDEYKEIAKKNPDKFYILHYMSACTAPTYND